MGRHRHNVRRVGDNTESTICPKLTVIAERLAALLRPEYSCTRAGRSGGSLGITTFVAIYTIHVACS